MDTEGGVVDCVQIDNSAKDLVAEVAEVAEVAKAGARAPVAIEATYGWYWAVDALQGAGFEVHLAHPKGNASMHNRRVKPEAAAEQGHGASDPGQHERDLDEPDLQHKPAAG